MEKLIVSESKEPHAAAEKRSEEIVTKDVCRVLQGQLAHQIQTSHRWLTRLLRPTRPHAPIGLLQLLLLV